MTRILKRSKPCLPDAQRPVCVQLLDHDETLRNVFAKKKTPAAADDTNKSKEGQAIELLKGLSPEQIMALISAINK